MRRKNDMRRREWECVRILFSTVADLGGSTLDRLSATSSHGDLGSIA